MSKIEFKDVSFSYSNSGKNSILEHMSTSFDSDKITVLTGPSGCGKSTILYLTAGIYPQYTGVLKKDEILVDGQRVGQLPPDKRCSIVNMMFQNPDLQFCMDTVENEVLFCLGNIRTPKEEMSLIMDSALEFCGITHLKNRTLQSLSGGEKQKAMLSCLIVLKPKWLLLDEPFANVDEKSAKELVQKIKQLHDKGTGILVVDHRLDYWLPIAHEIRLMDRNHRLEQIGHKVDELTDKMLVDMGLLAINGHYRLDSEEKNHEDIEPVLQLNKISVKRGNEDVLKDISATFYEKKVYAIVGESGSGKTTLFGAINGLYKYQGDILLKGKNIKKPLGYKAGTIGFVTQNPQDQFVTNTVLEEIELGLRRIKHKKGKVEEAEKILRGIGLWPYRNFSPYMLSQGQQRRLGVAALLTYDCQVLICDEPTYAQDKDNTISIMNGLMDRTKKRDMTLIISTHDHRLAQDYADVILQLKEGN